MRKLLIGLALPIVLVAAAAIVIPVVVPVGAYQGHLVTLVKEATGRDLKIAGPVKLTVLPRLALEASDVSLANVPGGRKPLMLELKQLRLQVDLLPLLHGIVVVNRMVLVQPVIALEVDKAGHPNWIFGPAAGSAVAPSRGNPGPFKAAGGFDISGFALRAVEVSGGRISYIDQRTGTAEQVDGVDLTLSQPASNTAIAGDGSAVWRGEKVSFAVNIDQPRALFDGAESQVAVKLAAAPITLDFSGRIAGLSPARLNGAIGLGTKSVRQLAKWVGSPITLGGNGLGPAAIKASVAVLGTKANLGDVDLSLDAIKAKGSISIDRGGARPVVSGRLDVEQLDLKPYLPSATASVARSATAVGPARNSPAPAKTSASDTQTGVSPLKLADIDLDLAVGGIVIRQFRIGASALSVGVKDGQLTADLSRMALYRGMGRGKVTVDATGATPMLRANLALSGVAIEPLTQAVMNTARLSGIGNLDIAATSRGTSQSDLISSLTGRGAFSLANGQIKGVDLLALAENAAQIERNIVKTLNVADAVNLLAHGQINQIIPLGLAESAATGLVGGSNTSNYGTLSGTYTVTNGVLRNNDLQLGLGVATMSGAGIVDLRTRAVDYRVNLHLAEGVTVPIQVSGTWDNLSYRPDLAAMLVQTPGNALAILRSTGVDVGQQLQGVGQGAVGVLKGIFGK